MENIENFFKDLMINLNIGFKEGNRNFLDYFNFRKKKKSIPHKYLQQYSDKKLKKQIFKAKVSAEKANKFEKDAKNSAKYAKDFEKDTKDSAKYAKDFEKDVKDSAKYAKDFEKDAKNSAKYAKDSAKYAKDSAKYAKDFEEDAKYSANNADESAEQADELVEQADESAQQALFSAMDACGNKILTDNTLKQLERNITTSLGVPSKSLDTIAAFQNIENFETIENSRTRAQEILNNPTKFNNFVSILENQIYANSENSKKTRLLQASELLTQKDTIASNIIMDYLYKNEKGTNVHKIYDRIDQLNDDKARKIEINTYYNKAYKEYINILKVIILVCIIIVPIIIANKNNMIPNSVTMFLVVAIIFLTVIFIIYKFSDIYMRDNKNFDKLRIPYDREAALLEKQGAITKKKNPLTSLTLTCIGEDCCDGSMVYDFAKNKCILSENFGGYFESVNNLNNGKTCYVKALDGTINESFANCNIKQNLVANSLKCSELNKFYSNECKDNFTFG